MPLGRRPLQMWVTITAIAVALAAVADKTVWELGPEWCAQYVLIKYMLYMEDSSCSRFGIKPPNIAIQPSSQSGKPLSETLRVHFVKLLDL